MNKDITLDSQTLKILWGSNKQYFAPFLMIFVSVILLFVTILPQFNNLLTTLTQRSDAQQKLQILNNNLVILTNADEDTLNSQLNTTLKALPQNKDFESVLTTISLAASKAGVGLGNFEFKVGDLSKSLSGNEQLPSLTINILVNDGADGASRFMTSLATTLPVSEIKSVDVNGKYSNVTIAFYYKNISTAKALPDARLVPLSVKQMQLLEELSTWDSSGSLVSPVPSSSSATTPF